MKTCIIALCRSTFFKRKTNPSRYRIKFSIVFFVVLRPCMCTCKRYFINVKSKHEERLIFDRLFVRVFLRPGHQSRSYRMSANRSSSFNGSLLIKVTCLIPLQCVDSVRRITLSRLCNAVSGDNGHDCCMTYIPVPFTYIVV